MPKNRRGPESRTMHVVVPAPRDAKGRITLSNRWWLRRMGKAITEATASDGGRSAWRFGEVVGDDRAGNVVLRLIRQGASL